MSGPDGLAPELEKPLRRFPTVDLQRRWVLLFARAATRFARPVKTEGVSVENVTDGGVTVRLFRPVGRASGAAMLWVHGGGLVAGQPNMDDAMLGGLVADLGIVVASVDYRRAPEHPYPAPLDDCLAGWLWLHRNAERLGVDSARVALGGESAGGGLAASLAHRLVDDGLVLPCAQWLMCPMLDDRTAARRDIGGRAHSIWNNHNNRFGWRSYLGVEPGAATVPAGAVPSRREDLTGLPKTWIGVAGLDLFAAEDLEYARRLNAAGVPTEVDLVDGAPHGFQSWGAGTELVRAYLERAFSWLGRAVSADADRSDGPSR